MAYNEFSYDLEKAWCNADVQRVVADARKADKSVTRQTDAIYGEFEKLARGYLAREAETCEDLDSQIARFSHNRPSATFFDSDALPHHLYGSISSGGESCQPFRTRQHVESITSITKSGCSKKQTKSVTSMK
jgi:hypothetical protein